MAAKKRDSGGAKTTPVSKPPADSVFAGVNPLGPKVSKADLAKAPDAPKETPKTKPKPTPERKAQPAYGARGGAPNNPQVAKPHKVDLGHEISTVLGTAAAGVKAIPGTLMTPIHVTASSSGEVGTDSHPPIADVHRQTWAEAMGAPPEKPKLKDHPDFLNGGRTKMTPADQAKIIKESQGGKLTPEQAKHINAAYQRGEIIPASIALSQLNIPLGNVVTHALAPAIAKLPDDQRQRVLDSLPTVHHFALFSGSQKDRQAYIDLRNSHGANLPEHPSDRQLIEDWHKVYGNDHEGYQRLNPFHHGFNPLTVIDRIGENYIHPALNDFIVAPAHIGAGTLGLAYHAGRKLGQGDLGGAAGDTKDSLATAGHAAGEGVAKMAQHPGEALASDPIGTAVTVATLGDTAVGKVLARAKPGWANTAREVELPHYDAKRSTELESSISRKAPAEDVLPQIEAATGRKQIGAGGTVESRGKIGTHGPDHAPEDIAPTIEAHINEDSPFTLTRGNKSIKPLTRVLQNIYDRYSGHGIFSRSPLTSIAHLDARDRDTQRLMTKGESLLGKDVTYTRDNVVGAAHRDVNALIEEMNSLGAHVPLKDQLDLLHSHAEGVSHADKQALFGGEIAKQEANIVRYKARLAKGDLKGFKKAKVKQKVADAEQAIKNLNGLIDWHGKQAPTVAFHELPKTHQDWLNAAKNVAEHRGTLLRERGKLSGASEDFRNYEVPILTAAKVGDGDFKVVAENIIKGRDALNKLEREFPDLKDLEAIQNKPRSARTKEEKKYIGLSHRLKFDLELFIAQYKVRHGLAEEGMSVGVGTHGGEMRPVEPLLGDPNFQNRMVPFRVPREQPSKTFGRGSKSTNPNPSDIVDPSLGFSTSKQLLTGDFTPSVSPLIKDAQKATKWASGYDYLQRLTDIPAGKVQNRFGVVKTEPGKTVGDFVEHPEHFVLRDVRFLRRTVPRQDVAELGTKSLGDPHAVAKELEDAYHGALNSRDLTADTPIPHTSKNGGEAEYVLVPKGVDNALMRDLAKRPARGPVNKLYRGQVLYTHPGFATRNLAQGLATNMIEGVGPFAYGRALAGRDTALGSLKVPGKKMEIAPGVENTGIAAEAVHGEFENAHSLARQLSDLTTQPVGTLKRAGNALNPLSGDPLTKGDFSALKPITAIPVHTFHTLIDTVKGLNVSFENFVRRAAYSKMAVNAARSQVDPGLAGIGKRISDKMRMSTDDIQSVLEHFADPSKVASPHAQAEAERTARSIIERIHEIQGDYKNMPAWSTAQLVAPFYRWTLFSTTLLMKMPWKHPFANQLLQGVGHIGQQIGQQLGQDFDQNGPLPTTLNFPIAGTVKDATTINAEWPNPFTTTLDTIHTPESLLPLVNEFYQTYVAKDTFGNPLKDENNQPLTTKGKLENAVTQAAHTLFPPLRNIESATGHAAPHSANSIPFIDEHDKYLKKGSQPWAQREYDKKHGKTPAESGPHDGGWDAFINWLTGLGAHNKNLDATEQKNVGFAFKDRVLEDRKTGPGSQIYADKYTAAKKRLIKGGMTDKQARAYLKKHPVPS